MCIYISITIEKSLEVKKFLMHNVELIQIYYVKGPKGLLHCITAKVLYI